MGLKEGAKVPAGRASSIILLNECLSAGDDKEM